MVIRQVRIDRVVIGGPSRWPTGSVTSPFKILEADVPERFGVRVGQEKACRIRIPDEADLTKATEAVLALRTWHGWDGHHEPLDLNGHRFAIRGKNHHYDYDMLPVPLEALKKGDNVLTIRSNTISRVSSAESANPASWRA